MAVLLDGTGGGGINTDPGSEETAPFTFGDAEPTVHEFVPGKPEQATRYTYIADASQVGYSLIVSQEAQKFPDLIVTVAGQLANTWNQNAAVPGVTDIGESQDVKPLGSLVDVYNVAVQSTSGRSEAIITLTDDLIRPDVFATYVSDERARLDKLEGSG